MQARVSALISALLDDEVYVDEELAEDSAVDAVHDEILTADSVAAWASEWDLPASIGEVDRRVVAHAVKYGPDDYSSYARDCKKGTRNPMRGGALRLKLTASEYRLARAVVTSPRFHAIQRRYLRSSGLLTTVSVFSRSPTGRHLAASGTNAPQLLVEFAVIANEAGEVLGYPKEVSEGFPLRAAEYAKQMMA